MLSHARALQVLRSHKATNAGIVLNLTTVTAEVPEVEDIAAHIDALQNSMWLDPLAGRGYPQGLISATEEIVDWSFIKQSELNEIAMPLDWLGVNYYTPTRITKETSAADAHLVGQSLTAFPFTPPVKFISNEPKTEMGWEIDASSLTSTLLRIAHR